VGNRAGSPEIVYNAARPPELTYTNSSYGLSFRFPSNFLFDKLSSFGPAAQRNMKPGGDPGEILLAGVLIPPGFAMATNATGILLLVGVNPKLSMEACAALVAPDDRSMEEELKLTVAGVVLTGRTEIEKNVSPGHMDKYGRRFTGYSNGLCYEFEISFALIPLDQRSAPSGRIPTDTGRLFTEMETIVQTAAFTKPMLPSAPAGAMAEHVTQPWETSLPFPKELSALEDLADWKVHYPTGAPSMHYAPIRRGPRKICGTEDADRYLEITFDYSAGASVDNDAANAAADKLSADVIRLIGKNGWQPVYTAGNSPSEFEGCHTNGSVFLTTHRGTGRCTAHSPCTVWDIVSVSVFIPAAAEASTP
jgi:hypothetical protein